EYSALKFGLFFFGEYTHVVTTSFLMVILFFGGWQLPWIAEAGQAGLGFSILKLIVFILKMTAFIVFYMLFRWTLPAFPFVQLMGLGWRVMIPLSLINVIAVMVVKQVGASEWTLLPISVTILIGAGLLAGYWPKGPEREMVVTRGRERFVASSE